MSLVLLDNASAGTGDVFPSQGSARTLKCSGTFGTGTVYLDVSEDGATWVTPSELTFKADTVINFQIGAGMKLRGRVEGDSTGIRLVLI